jgi:hypothetical protein
LNGSQIEAALNGWTLWGHLKKRKFMYAKACRRGFWDFGAV